MGFFINNDDVMVKKDDDFKWGKMFFICVLWVLVLVFRMFLCKMIKWFVIVLVVGFFVYLFIKNLLLMDD